jgi:hypothetical protein
MANAQQAAARLAVAETAYAADQFSTVVKVARPLALAGNLRANQLLGIALFRLGDLDGATTALRRVLARSPQDAQNEYNLALIELANGDWTTGFKHFEARRQIRPLPAYLERIGPMWRGGDLDNRSLLIYAEQGLGDTIQFCRYISFLKERGARTYLAAHPELRSLFLSLPGVDHVLAPGDPVPKVDDYVMTMSLPGILGCTPTDALLSDPYLQAAPAQLPNGPGVGIVWAGQRSDRDDRFRSLNAPILGRLIERLGSRTVYSLQKDGEDELDIVSEAKHVVRLGKSFSDFAHTASIIAALDLVITVDTSVAHLAGALGKATWLLLSATPDWRWLRGGDQTIWYPNMRLFRQKTLGLWDSVLDELSGALRDPAD